MQREVVFIMGPTASGKTDLALRIAARFPVHLISVDSAMVYRGLNIGTGKPDAAMQARYPHALIDIVDPAVSYSAGQFRSDALQQIELALSQQKVPVLVGGTMLYFRALREGLAELPAAHPDIRAQIDAEAAARGWPAMHAELAGIDPVAARRIQPNDSQRIQRALEVFRVSGRPLTEWHAQARGHALPYPVRAFAWCPADREALYARIQRRFDAMMAAGFLDEVRGLMARGDLGPHLPSIRSVGYRQLWEHLAGAYSLAEGVRRAVLATRHLARRQLIWLRGLQDITWLDSLEVGSIDDIYTAIEEASRKLVEQ
jgi:tRNA dimethylallyltransferase